MSTMASALARKNQPTFAMWVSFPYSAKKLKMPPYVIDKQKFRLTGKSSFLSKKRPNPLSGALLTADADGDVAVAAGRRLYARIMCIKGKMAATSTTRAKSI